MTATLDTQPTSAVGSMTPRLFTPPLEHHCTGPKPDSDGVPIECLCGCGLNPETSWGFSCNKFAKQVLGWKLQPWQEWLNIHGLEKNDEDGGFRFKILVVLIARQQGKTYWLKCLGLWRLFMSKHGRADAACPGAKLAVIAAQNLQYAEGMLKEIVDEIRDNPSLAPELINHRVCLDVDTPILTTAGWKTMQTVQVGDEVYHPDGHPTQVIEVNPIYDDHACYELTTSDGRSVICDEQHLWTVQDRRYPRRIDRYITEPAARRRRGATCIICDERQLARGYCSKHYQRWKAYGDPLMVHGSSHKTDSRFEYEWETISTGEMLRRGLRRPGASPNANAFRLPKQQRIESKNVDLPIDPYTLGYWLGDGDSHTSRITVSEHDAADLLNTMSARNSVARKVDREDGYWRIWFDVPQGSLWTQLRALGVADPARYPAGAYKHVPKSYLLAGTEQREELLAGLLDSDGSISVKGRVVFTNKSEALADAVMHLARSLGFTPRLHIKPHVVGGKNYGNICRVMFTPHEQVFRLPRKAARITAATPPGVYIKSITPVHTRPVRCIKVDRSDGLFLAGKDLLVTHNTNGNHRAILSNRRYWRAATATRKGGRSLSVDIAMLDELREHVTTDAWDAIAPTTTVRPFSQIVCTSNAGDKRSVVLRGLRDQALRRITTQQVSDATTGLFEWSVPTDVDPADERYWYMANPALGVLNNFKLSDLRAMFEAQQYRNLPGFMTEHLCMWVDALSPGIIPAQAWADTLDKESRRADGSPLYVGVDINYERSRSFIAVAARRADGNLHIEIMNGARGTDWVIPWLAERKGKFVGVAIQKTGAPISGMLEDFRAAGIPVVEWGPGVELAGGCSLLHDGIVERKVYHRPAPALDRAAASGVSRNVGEGWVFDRRSSPVDVSPIISCAAAVWLEHQRPSAPPQIHGWPSEDTIAAWEAEAEEKFPTLPTQSRRLDEIEGTTWWRT